MPVNEIVRIDGKTKAAIVAISLGTESAADVFKNLKQDEVEQLIIEIAKIGSVEPEVQEMVLQQFYDLCLAQKYITEGGMEYAREVLEKAFGPQDAHTIIDKITSTLKIRAFDFIRKIEPQYLIGFLQNEHPQTIALILSYAKIDQAAQILTMLPRDKQLEVTERMATLDRTSPEIIRDVEKSLEKKLSSVFTDQYMEAGGVSNVAEILNHVDRGTEKYISEELYKRNQSLAEEIRNRMFVFEDITTLDPISIQRVLSDVDTKDLMIALKGAKEDVKELIYDNMSTRIRDTIREDIEFLRGIRVRDVDEAQQKIVNIVRDLEDKGEITVQRGGLEDEFI